MTSKYTSFEVAQVFYAYLDKRVSWEAFKRIYNEFLGVDQ
jgi:hypothetical protein